MKKFHQETWELLSKIKWHVFYGPRCRTLQGFSAEARVVVVSVIKIAREHEICICWSS